MFRCSNKQPVNYFLFVLVERVRSTHKGPILCFSNVKHFIEQTIPNERLILIILFKMLIFKQNINYYKCVFSYISNTARIHTYLTSG